MILQSILIASNSATAGSVAGTGGATEVTQIVNMNQLVASYAQQVQQYENQLMQYATMVQQLKANPLGVVAPDLQRLVASQARLMAAGKDIGSSMSKVDLNFAQVFKNPQAATLAAKFQNWTNNSSDALKAAMLNAGLHREGFSSDQTALQGLVDRVSASDGTVAGLQALGSLNAAQLNESMKLRDLISQQQLAQNNYLAGQVAKEKDASILVDPYVPPIPDMSSGKGKFVMPGSIIQK